VNEQDILRIPPENLVHPDSQRLDSHRLLGSDSEYEPPCTNTGHDKGNRIVIFDPISQEYYFATILQKKNVLYKILYLPSEELFDWIHAHHIVRRMHGDDEVALGRSAAPTVKDDILLIGKHVIHQYKQSRHKCQIVQLNLPNPIDENDTTQFVRVVDLNKNATKKSWICSSKQLKKQSKRKRRL
tara:strand:- start:429 stop:983 length:555 start_codon:yes stop_codon:yes gene_type:complete